MFLNRLRSARARWMPRGAQLSFSQCGEDRIVAHLFSTSLKISTPTFLDIGANDPVKLNNTYLMSLTGSTGVLIEPDASIAEKIRTERPKDKCLNIGIADGDAAGEKSIADFYIFDQPVLNTFSQSEAEETQRQGYKLARTATVPLLGINRVLSENFKTAPDFVSLDTEGFDEKILTSWDFNKYRPCAFCVETLSFTTGEKIKSIVDLMMAADYRSYADTYLNTIFVASDVWKRSGLK